MSFTPSLRRCLRSGCRPALPLWFFLSFAWTVQVVPAAEAASPSVVPADLDLLLAQLTAVPSADALSAPDPAGPTESTVPDDAADPAETTEDAASTPAEVDAEQPWAYDPDDILPDPLNLQPPMVAPSVALDDVTALPRLTLAEPRPFGLNGVLAPLPAMTVQRVSMPQVVAMTLANNTDVQIRRYAPDLGDAQVRAAFGAFDPNFSISFTYNQSETPQNAEQFIATGGATTATQLSLIDTLEQLLAEIRGEEAAIRTGTPLREPRVFRQENYLASMELGGKLPTGTRYGLRLNLDRYSNDVNRVRPPGIYSPEYASYAGVVITQPLLRDFGFDANMAEVRVARANRQIGWLDWKAQLNRSVAETLSAYIDLLFAESDVAVKREAADLARLLQEQNLRRQQLGLMGPVDVSQARSAVAEAEEREFLALSFAVERQGNLQRLILGEAPPAALWFAPVENLTIPELRPDRSRLLMQAFELRPEYLRAREEVEKQKVLVRYNRNQVLPRVDAQTSYGVLGLNSDYGSSLDTALDGQGFDFGVGVVVSVPLGSVTERANLDAAKMNQAQADIALTRAGLDVTVDIDTALSLLEAARARVRAAADFLEAAVFNLNSEQAMLEEGRSTTFNVVKFQNDLSLARTRKLAAQAEYRRAAVRLGLAAGTLLDEFGVNIEEEAARLRPLTKNPPPAEVLR